MVACSSDGRDVTNWEPRLRDIGYVPQDYALFPHLSVEQNIASGLRAHGRPREQINERIDMVAEMLGIGHLLKRRIPGLSGGERQRVALGRALAIEPRVLLLDEPVSALDESTRERVCRELRQLQRKLNITTIHVSHNLEEAFSLADRGGILRDGRFQQIGSLRDLLRHPTNEFVARFMRCQNILSGRALGPGPAGTTRVGLAGVELLVPCTPAPHVKFVIRPESLRLVRADVTSEDRHYVALPVELAHWVDLGSYIRLDLNGAVPLVAHLSPTAFAELHADHQTKLLATIDPESVHLLPAEE